MLLSLPVTDRKIIICRDLDELSRQAAAQFVVLAQQAIIARGRFTVALSGGSTPKALYSLLATDELKQQLTWQKIHLFWGDERCVSPDHTESNFRIVKESLLTKVQIPTENVHRMAGELAPFAAAIAYERELEEMFLPLEESLPRFDLLLLGLGEDGHTASLFPGSAALNESARLVVPNYIEKLNAYRLTLTLPVINNGAQIYFLVAGKNKASMVKEILQRKTGDYPAARIQPTHGQLTWFITQDAADNLALSH